MGIFNMVGGGGGGGYKSFTQLKAMTLAEAITELNTDPQGYYDNLNGNGHIIGIGIANDDKTSYQCFDSVTPIIYWNGSWRNGEIVIVKIKTNSSGNLMIPKAGFTTSGSQSRSYNWRVSYDNGSETQYSGTGSAGSITIASGLTADTEHTVVIRPNSESYQWARAFGFYNSGVEARLTEIVYDGSYKGYGTSSALTGDNFRNRQYQGCTALTSTTQEVLPNTVTSIGIYFRRFQYGGCTALTTIYQEILPNTVSSIPGYFRAYQYDGCTSLISATQEVLPNTITSIGNYFRGYQYRNTSLTSQSIEILPSSVTSIGNYFRSYQYYGCTSLTSAAQEVLPNTVTSIGNYFRSYQYNGCTSLTTAPSEVLPNTVTSIGNNFRDSQYSGCTSLTTIGGWIDLSIGNSSYRYNQFANCNSNKTIKVLSNVGYDGQSSTLNNSYVSVVLVPSAYLQNYIDATTYPRRTITDSKFVGY